VTWKVALFSSLVLAGCVGAFMPEEAEPFDPPASYRAMWDSAQACTGRTRPFERVAFFKVPGRSFETPDNDRAAGHASEGRVILAERWMAHPMVVKHEMIHALGVYNHPRDIFERACKATWDSWDVTSWLLPLE
jgi:hypothetical protein